MAPVVAAIQSSVVWWARRNVASPFRLTSAPGTGNAPPPKPRARPLPDEPADARLAGLRRGRAPGRRLPGSPRSWPGSRPPGPRSTAARPHDQPDAGRAAHHRLTRSWRSAPLGIASEHAADDAQDASTRGPSQGIAPGVDDRTRADHQAALPTMHTPRAARRRAPIVDARPTGPGCPCRRSPRWPARGSPRSSCGRCRT